LKLDLEEEKIFDEAEKQLKKARKRMHSVFDNTVPGPDIPALKKAVRDARFSLTAKCIAERNRYTQMCFQNDFASGLREFEQELREFDEVDSNTVRRGMSTL